MSSEFTLETIQQLLAELARRLAAEGIHAGTQLFSGAAVMLSGSIRRTTKDIDASYAPKEAVEKIAAGMAQDLDLPKDWLTLAECDDYQFSWTGSLVDWAVREASTTGDRDQAFAAARENRDA